MNFAQRYLTGNKLGLWRDTHFRITGVAVAGLQSSFLSDWYTVSRKVVNMDRYFDPNALANAYSPSIQFVQGGPFTHWHVLEQAIIYLISRANRYRDPLLPPDGEPQQRAHHGSAGRGQGRADDPRPHGLSTDDLRG